MGWLKGIGRRIEGLKEAKLCLQGLLGRGRAGLGLLSKAWLSQNCAGSDTPGSDGSGRGEWMASMGWLE